MRFATPLQVELEGWGESSAAIVAMGLALAVAGIVQTITVPATQPVLALELFVSLLVPTGLATGGFWLASHNVSPNVRWRAATWVSIGIVAACGLGGWLLLYVSLEGGAIHGPLSLVTSLAAVGGATGFVAAVRVTPQAVIADSTTTAETVREADPATEPPREDVAGRDTEHEADAATDTEGDTALEAVAGSSAVSVPNSTPTRPARSDEVTASIGPAVPSEPIVPDDADPLAPSSSELEPGVERVAAVSETTETVLEILRDERARLVLASLYHDCEGAQSLDDLARVVADHTDQCAATATVSLRHATLPRLEAVRAVDWDPHADRVTAPAHAVFEEGVRDASALLESFEPGTR